MKITICKTSDIKLGETKTFKYGLWQGILIRDADGFHAFKSFCTHMGGPVKAGGDGNLHCQWHYSKFDPKTGAALPGSQAPEGTFLPKIEVTLDGDAIVCSYEPPKDPFEM